jgi:signal transduction histidine kinase/type II secretory pathway pseudopilin PulG
VLAVLFWALAWFGYRSSEHSQDPQRIARLIGRDLKERFERFQEIENHRDDVKTWLQQNALGQEWVYNKPFHLFAYRHDSLLAWSNSTVLPPQRLPNPGRFYSLSNGYYYGFSYQSSWLPAGVWISVLFPIATRYPLSNDYLQSGFAASATIDPKTILSDTASAGAAPVLAPDGHIAAYVREAKGLHPACAPPVWVVASWLLFVFCIALWVHLYAQRLISSGRNWAGLALVALCIVLLFSWRFLTGLPFHIGDTAFYSARLFGVSRLLPSLGDFYFQILAALWLLHVTERSLRSHESPRIVSITVQRLLAFGCSLIAGFVAVLFLHLLRSLVLDSLIPFDTAHLSSLDRNAVAGLFASILLLAAMLQFLRVIRRLLSWLVSNLRVQSILLLAGVALPFIIFLNAPLSQAFLLVGLWLILVVLLQQWSKFREKDIAFHSVNLFWSVLHCLLLSLLLQGFIRERELIVRKNFAERLATRQDDALEYNFSQIEPYLRSDTSLQHFLMHPTRAGRDSLEERLGRLYFSNGFAAYQAQTFLFDVSNRPLYNSDTSSITQLVAVTQEEVPSRTSPSLYYREAATSDHIYLGIIEVKDDDDKLLGILIIDLEQKKIVAETVLPELLQPGAINQIQKAAGYSYAVYADRKLVAQTSDYPFPFYIPKDTGSKEFFERRGKEFSTLIYTPDEHRTVYVWHRLGSLSESLTLFSYLLLLRFLLLAIQSIYRTMLAWRQRPRRSRLVVAMGLRRRVQLAVMGIVACSFLLIGVITVVFLSRQYTQTNKAKRQAMMQTVSRAIQQYMKEANMDGDEAQWRHAMEHTRFRYFLGRIAANQKIDINLFDQNGRLAVSTQQPIYDLGLLAPVMRPDALATMYTTQPKLLQKDDETIGSLRYISCYVPLRDAKANIAGFLNVPLFYSQRDLEEQISSVVVALINLYAMIFLLSSLMAVLITRWITRAFDIIIRQFGRLALHGNEPLQWPYEDEIGILVAEYNKMVQKVEENVALLAKSERESAFREMAQQVAHEIKNPLTPMKLNVQYLQRAIQSGQGNVTELARRTSESLLEQINNLSVIATEFSDFARIGSRPERIDLKEVVNKVVDLFVHEERIAIECRLSDEHLVVMADRSQLVRIINNLMQNAIQAIPAERDGRVHVRLFANANDAVLEVQDNGQGISEETEQKLFTPYFTTKTSGTGLGLAMTRQMVEVWGGSISYTTELGIGTTFVIRLPMITTLAEQ